jgi:hypothetical protein
MTTTTELPPAMTVARLQRAVRYIRANPTRLSIAGASIVETAALREQATRDWRMVLVAALRECARPAPSWPEIGTAAGCAFSTAMVDYERFAALAWRDRYAWLDLVERVVCALERDDPMDGDDGRLDRPA